MLAPLYPPIFAAFYGPSTIRAAICEDEVPTCSYLTSPARARGCPCGTVECASAGDGLADHRGIDLLSLDAAMNANGPGDMALDRRIGESNLAAQSVSILVTGCGRYGFDAFDRGAFQTMVLRAQMKRLWRASFFGGTAPLIRRSLIVK